jgi:hypothetical protein
MRFNGCEALVWSNIQATMETTSEQLQSAKASSLVPEDGLFCSRPWRGKLADSNPSAQMYLMLDEGGYERTGAEYRPLYRGMAGFESTSIWPAPAPIFRDRPYEAQPTVTRSR